jgi:glycosidase
MRRAARHICAALGVAWLAVAPSWAAEGALHVPSPDWRDQIIYFALTDRFADGDPGNNDQGAGEFKPGDPVLYNGGDLKGLRERLAYIQGLGATALWITPPVANQWLDPGRTSAGYHGYWAEHFQRVDAHLGSLADLQALSRALHGRGMHLVQDIVVNHTGNYFKVEPPGTWRALPATPPVPRPSQPPFHRNDASNPADRRAAIYHWTPDVADYTQAHQELNYQMSGLDDLNTENPLVRRTLRHSYGWWIEQAGVDAFRVDTAFYVPPGFFRDFLHARDAAAPGIHAVARRTGRQQFHVFGEGFGIDKPYRDEQARKIDRWMRDGRGPDGTLLPGMLNFPLYGALGDTFARGRAPAELAHRITQTMRLHARPHLMPSFIDNHDVDRFLKGGTTEGLRQALLALMTLPGIPVIYYGTEQGFTEPRAAMFAAGYGSGGRDRYDDNAPLYRDIAAMTALRKAHRVFSRGVPTVLHASAAGPGALAWGMRQAGPQALVVMNTASAPRLLPAVPTGLAPGTRLRGLYGLHGEPAWQVVGAGGRITLVLPAHSGQVWLAEPAKPAAATPAPAARAPWLDPLPVARVSRGAVEASGRGAGALVLDGDLASAQAVQPGADGRWRARVDASALIDPGVPHELTLWADGAPAAPPRRFFVQPRWLPLAAVADPAGDDTGPDGRYRYPTDPSWGANRQMDLRGVKVSGAGGALRLELQMGRTTTLWNPANGFDHVAFTVFIELPGQPGGANVMPLQDGTLPEGLRWHRRLRVGGWSNALFSSEGATVEHEGTPVSPGATVAVHPQRHTITLTLPAAALGGMPSLQGVRLWVTTWDYDAGYRALAPEPQPHAMSVSGGGAPAGPKVMDSSAVIRLP